MVDGVRSAPWREYVYIDCIGWVSSATLDVVAIDSSHHAIERKHECSTYENTFTIKNKPRITNVS